MARASYQTLLSLDRYAKILGINPAHFNSVAGTNVMPVTGSCHHLWFQHAWQNTEAVSREDVAQAIANAEWEIAELLGYHPAPRYIAKEMHVYPHHHRREVLGLGLTPIGKAKAVKAKWGKFIQAGQRALTLVGTATTAGGTLTFVDDDGDGFAETVRIALATTLTDPTDIKAFYPGKSGEDVWEIRPAKSKTISGGTLVMKFWIWQIVDENLMEALVDADGSLGAVDIDTVTNFLDSIEVYLEYTDFTQESCQFFWEPPINMLTEFCSACCGAGCIACSLTVQDGCIHVRDVDLGLVVPMPATYNSEISNWAEMAPAVCREPDIIKFWYYAGDIWNRFLDGLSYDPLSDFLAEAITLLATARLGRPFCGCSTLTNMALKLQRDMAFSSGEEGAYNVTFGMLDNPFGTRLGEVMAWKRLHAFTRKVGHVAVI
jgi:hypothetical protein